jgi:hypothetical protein
MSLLTLMTLNDNFDVLFVIYQSSLKASNTKSTIKLSYNKFTATTSYFLELFGIKWLVYYIKLQCHNYNKLTLMVPQTSTEFN